MKRLIAVALLAVGAGSAFAVELVTNGGFEAGTTSPPAGWTGTIGGASGVNSGLTLGTAHAGTNWYGMGATAATTQTDLFQDLTTTVGTSYTASFWARDEDPLSSGHLGVSFGGITFGPIASVPNTWTQYSTTLVATSALTRLEFTGWETLDWMTVDDFSVQAAVTPEPAPFVALALGAMVLVRRRRNRKA